MGEREYVAATKASPAIKEPVKRTATKTPAKRTPAKATKAVKATKASAPAKRSASVIVSTPLNLKMTRSP